MNLIVSDLTKTKDDIEIRTLNKEFENKKKRVEQIDKQLKKFKGETRAVSYTHLDVYKRQVMGMEESKLIL